VRAVDAVVRAYERAVAGARAKAPVFDHAWRAKLRFEEVHGGRLAAAISYYGFFAAFAAGLLAFAILGIVLKNNQTAVTVVQEYLRGHVPQLDTAQIAQASTGVGIAGLAGFVLTGIGWVEGMRSSMRAVWRIDQQPGNPLARRGIDLLVLIGLGLLLAASLTVNWAVTRFVGWVSGNGAAISHWAGPLLGFVVDVVIAAALLAGLPRLRIPRARLVPAALLVAVGFTLLKTVGGVLTARIVANPAYGVLAGTAGLLIFLNFFNQLLLYASALAATARRGTVHDLAVGRGMDRRIDESQTG